MRSSRISRSRPFGLPRRWLFLRLGEILGRLLALRSKRGGGTLLIRFYGVGDALIFRAGLLAWLRSNDPIARQDVTILGSNSWEFVQKTFFADLPDNVRLKFLDERRFAKSVLYRARIIAAVRRAGYDRVACLMHYRNPLTADALVANSGAREREVVIGDEPQKWRASFNAYRRSMTCLIPSLEHKASRTEKDPEGGPVYPHEIERLIDAFNNWRELNIGVKPPLKLAGPKSLNISKEVLSGPFGIVIPGSSNANRSMPPPQAAGLALALAERLGHAIILGGPGERDMLPALNAALEERCSEGARVTISLGDYSFTDAMALIGEARLVVGQDTGPTHAALMMGVPTVTLHSEPAATGAKEWGSFMPYPSGSQTGPSFHLLYPLERFRSWNPAEGMVPTALIAIDQMLELIKNSSTEHSSAISMSWRELSER